MAPPKSMTLREMEAKGSWDQSKKSIWFKKENWAKVTEQIRQYKTNNQEITAENKDLKKQLGKMTDDFDKLSKEYKELKESKQLLEGVI